MNAVTELVSQIPCEINAAIMIVLHLSGASIGTIVIDKLRKHTELPCKIAEDNDTIVPGTIYLAPPDAHLLVNNDKTVIGYGPPENRFRPSIDVLFRSLAAHFGERSIGVILTGFLNDGTSGCWAIKQSGGHCIVQDPNEAEYPDMPISVLETMEVDYNIPLKMMGVSILQVTEQTKLKGIPPPSRIIAESRLSEKTATGIDRVRDIGEKTDFSCPDCGGGLWKISNGHVSHYRCHVGHSYNKAELDVRQADAIEKTLWVALRMMEERKILLSKTAKENNTKGLSNLSQKYTEHSLQLEGHIENLKVLLFSIHKEDHSMTA
jgi:two-component system, chemotaxis family, protein-glutamate methylesterase/glutaminase